MKILYRLISIRMYLSTFYNILQVGLDANKKQQKTCKWKSAQYHNHGLHFPTGWHQDHLWLLTQAITESAAFYRKLQMNKRYMFIFSCMTTWRSISPFISWLHLLKPSMLFGVPPIPSSSLVFLLDSSKLTRKILFQRQKLFLKKT